MRLLGWQLGSMLASAAVVGCSGGGESSPGAGGSSGTAGTGATAGQAGQAGSAGSAPMPATYPLTPEPYTTLQMVWEPLPPTAATEQLIENREVIVTEHDRFESLGLGIVRASGNPWSEQDQLAPGFVLGTERRSLLYVWQAADPQVIDEESPIRVEAFEGLYRPHGHLIPQAFEAHVRTAARINEAGGRPFDFALLAGDLTDGSQQNELEWVLTALAGGVIDPDSGVDDDPVPGPGNDYNDPFVSDGIDLPWYAVLGNHETLYNGGIFQITDEMREASVGGEVYDFPAFENGYRDGSTLLGDVVTSGTTPADERRLVLRRGEVLQHLLDAPGEPPGHGLSQAHVDDGRGYFSVAPLDGKPIRLIAVDTVYTDAPALGIGSQGWIEREQFDWLRDELIAADARNELIIVMSHHRMQDLSARSPATEDEVTALLAASQGVVLHVTGHGHRNRRRSVSSMPTTPDERGYWELMLASTVDFPMHTRAIEVVDERNGFITIYTTNIGQNSPEDSLAHQARFLAAAKRPFPGLENVSDIPAWWASDLDSQNLMLRIPVPDAVRDELQRHEWPTRIESEETLATFSAP